MQPTPLEMPRRSLFAFEGLSDWGQVDLAVWFYRLACLACILGSSLAMSLTLADPDLWGHVIYGEELLATGELPATATHTFTSSDHRWINHENIAEIVFALSARYGGGLALLWGKLAIGMTLLALMYRVARRHGSGSLSTWFWLLVVANNLTAFVIIRPQLFSFLGMSLLLALLDRGFQETSSGDRMRRTVHVGWLAPIPLLLVIWTNAHGGFLVGLGILGFYLAGRMIQIARQQGMAAMKSLALIAVVGIVSAAVTLLNPYRFELLHWLIYSLGTPRPEITEWRPPQPGDPIFWPWATLIALSLMSLIGTKLRRDWLQIIILGLVGWQSSAHLRHIAFLAILCGFWVTPHFSSFVSRLKPEGPRLGLGTPRNRGLPCWR